MLRISVARHGRMGFVCLSLALSLTGALPASAQEIDFDAQRISVYEGAEGLRASTRADFDRDGLLDIVACTDTRLVFFRGRALDGFAPPVEFAGSPGAGRAEDAARGDFDGDGDFDVVLGHQSGVGNAGLSIFDGDGAGGFAAPRFVPLPQSAHKVVTADLDDDDSVDLVVRTDREWLMTLLGDGAGGFSLVATVEAEDVTRMSIADLDADGFEDVVTTRMALNQVVTLFSDGVGGLDPGQTIGSDSPGDILAGDFDADGEDDFAVLLKRNGVNSRVGLYRNAGGGALMESATVVDPEFRIGSLLVVADFDSNGIAELLTVYGTRVRLFPGDGAGGFETPVTALEGVALPSVEVGDFDGDARRDLVSTGLRRVALFRGDGNGGFIRYDSTPSIGSAARPILGHVDQDGQLDAVAVDEFAHVYPGTGAAFPTRSSVALTRPGLRSALGDFDGDGDTDIAVTGQSSGAGFVEVLWGDGSSVPGAAGQDSFVAGPRADDILAADFDLDGNLDITVTNRAEVASGIGSVTTLLGDGAGAFATLPGVPCGSEPERIATGDFDDDGLPDLAVSKRWGSALFLLRGDGSGAFASVASSPWNLDPAALAVADFDGDGRDDVVQSTVDESDNLVDWARVLTRTGAFTFASQTIRLAHPAPNVAAADFDGNGLLDVGTSNGDFLLSDGSGGFTAVPFEFVTPSIVGGFGGIGDVDLDGLPDVVVSLFSVALNRTLDPDRARRGNVNAAAGSLADVLRFNGSRGVGSARRVAIGPSDPAVLTVALPPSREGKRAKFALYEWMVASPGSSDVNRLPLAIGFSILRAPSSPAIPASLPVRIWNNAGRNGFLGTPDLPSEPAPTTVYSLPGGIGFSATLVYQGIIVDPDAPNGRGGMTNAVEVVVQ